MIISLYSPFRIFALLLLCFSFFLLPQETNAREISLIRDAEIENTIRTYSTPVFRAAGLDPSAVNIYIVNDSTLNAFVAGGQNIFMNTGLLMRADNASQIIGVIAHETGHISGGHLSRLQDALSKSSIPTILSMIVGGAAAIATGRGDVGAVIAMGGQSIGQRNFLSYSRGQEASADHAALKLLDATKQSARGIHDFLKVLRGQELLSISRQDPYLRSHPLSEDRIKAVEHHVEASPYSNAPLPDEYEEMHQRMQAKLIAFTTSLGRTLHTYKGDLRSSLAGRYALSIAYFRKGELKKAVPLIDSLINERPGDPYFKELKGQMLFENGRVEEALPYYQKSVELLPNSALLRYELARVQLESMRPELIEPAIANLRAALTKEPKAAPTWHQLAIAYGRLGEKGHSSLALAEKALLTNKPEIAQYHGGLAERLFSQGSREWLQAQDIQIAAKDLARRLNNKK